MPPPCIRPWKRKNFTIGGNFFPNLGQLEFLNFVKKIHAFPRFFNAVFNEKSRRDSMKIVAYQKTSFL